MKRGWNGSGDFKKQRIVLDGVTLSNADGFYDARGGREKIVFHFHGLENHQAPPRLHKFTGAHEHAGELVPVSYTQPRAHETVLGLVCRLLLGQNKTRDQPTLISLDGERTPKQQQGK